MTLPKIALGALTDVTSAVASSFGVTPETSILASRAEKMSNPSGEGMA